MANVGVKIADFDVPVCNAFKPKIQNDQICYEIDLESFSNKTNIDRELKLGFNFLLDYNEDRQVTFDERLIQAKEQSLANSYVESDQNWNGFIYLDTVGKQVCFKMTI